MEENEYHSFRKMRPKGLHFFSDGRSLQNPRNAKDPYRKTAHEKLSFIQEKRKLWSKKLKSILKSIAPKMFHKCIDCFVGVVVGGKSLFKLNVFRLISFAKCIIGNYTFQEAFDRSGRILNITVAPVNNFDPPRLLNYLTAPHVCVWSASVASCAIPGELIGGYGPLFFYVVLIEFDLFVLCFHQGCLMQFRLWLKNLQVNIVKNIFGIRRPMDRVVVHCSPVTCACTVMEVLKAICQCNNCQSYSILITLLSAKSTHILPLCLRSSPEPLHGHR